MPPFLPSLEPHTPSRCNFPLTLPPTKKSPEIKVLNPWAFQESVKSIVRGTVVAELLPKHYKLTWTKKSFMLQIREQQYL